MSEAELLASLTKKERAYLSRRVCGWCDKQLSRQGCCDIFAENCKDEVRIKRIKSCLAEYKPRITSLTVAEDMK